MDSHVPPGGRATLTRLIWNSVGRSQIDVVVVGEQPPEGASFTTTQLIT
jgi:hypothetical protein